MPTLTCVLLALAAICLEVVAVSGKSDPGLIDIAVDAELSKVREQRPLLADTEIYVKIQCASDAEPELSIQFTLTEHPCLYDDNMLRLMSETPSANASKVISTVTTTAKCVSLIPLRQKMEDTIKPPPGDLHPIKQNKHPYSATTKPFIKITEDGIYELELIIQTIPAGQSFKATVGIEFLGPHGYISAIDWPFLPFYLIMCIVYVIFGIIWLLVSFAQWRDLLRIQFWIGGVILLGMLEKAFFYAEYQTLSSTGVTVQHAELVAEFVSCAKRTLARMLVIIMSLGFGIVKPRLGPMLHRVVGVGLLYFILACIESYLRITNVKSERSELLVASIPLAVLDTGICWWIFTSLVQTTRTLRLRRNMVKLALYRHFTNTLIFAVIASVIFMLFALRLRRTENCTPGWRDIWVDTGFWHILFSVLLLVIMILWRPTNNNQRYAFTPLLDNPEDEDEEEEEDQFVADTYGVKMRSSHQNGTSKPPANARATTTEEDDLRWVEENIPSSMADPALPVLDSDEEIINTKFEVSKMQ
ncbi:transmembrane protein 87A [Scaptodrosophila lebanonensis]|uniref:Transmembrane protein 87A n=1 Tax=Drosophila lebanonensis TaxID=7225 RepID=A0A6J2U7J6_DROLE|nr:transmembrane protein 87A [Scaptodrosophila lebanonensis]